ncbi:RNAse III [Penicillium taxi]|uniref:RNAse III n=1 Tax=Penicillium taxi TaxID=168475 RepID=UPI002544E19E|nr:RNAse III [Penicillium taxi]KAJ5894099.1 RNAse III [Penicillium taxi]
MVLSQDQNSRLALIGPFLLKVMSHLNSYDDRSLNLSDMNHIENGRTCSTQINKIGLSKGLDRLIYVNPAQGNHVSPGVMMKAVEAIVGAVFLDSDHNIEITRKVAAQIGFFDIQ